MKEYHKIPGPFIRHVSGEHKNKLIPWAWTSPELEFLADTEWIFTEKIDGTNIRVIWDGHKPEFRGRTDKAQLPPKLLTALTEMFPEELFEQKFGSDTATLYGEGYGAGIQKGGGNYRSDNSFILFDVRVGDWWLTREAVHDIARSLGIDEVPYSYTGTLREAIAGMAKYGYHSQVAEKNDVDGEGWVGTPAVPLFARNGDRIIVKLKVKDLYGLDLRESEV